MPDDHDIEDQLRRYVAAVGERYGDAGHLVVANTRRRPRLLVGGLAAGTVAVALIGALMVRSDDRSVVTTDLPTTTSTVAPSAPTTAAPTTAAPTTAASTTVEPSTTTSSTSAPAVPVCADVLAPPSLPNGEPLPPAVVDESRATWGDMNFYDEIPSRETARGIVQFLTSTDLDPLTLYDQSVARGESPQPVIEIGGGRASLIPVGDPPLGAISVAIDQGTGCRYRFALAQGLTLEEARDFVASWLLAER
jgi:hypothetical protein